MKTISESHLRSLGFHRNDVPMADSGCEQDFYYYSMDINNVCLLSDADDEVKDNQWTIHLLEGGLAPINDLDDLVKLIHLLKKYEKK
jgi:hypothetical protein